MATIRRQPFAQRPIMVEALRPEQITSKYAKKVRHGKTHKDRANNAYHRTALNRGERSSYTSWCAEVSSAAVPPASAWARFPWTVCNGRRTRALRARPSKKN